MGEVTALIIGMTMFVGLFVGSFLNVIIDRLPSGEPFWSGRSRCDSCKQPLRWFELIPLVSFVIQRRRCRRCGVFLSLQYPLLEIVTGLVFGVYVGLLSPLLLSEPIKFMYGLVFVCSLIIITAIDIKHGIIPDEIIYFHVIAFLVYVLIDLTGNLLALNETSQLLGWINIYLLYVVAACSAGLFFYLLVLFTNGKGMGGGDVKFAFVMGLVLGPLNTLIAIYLAFIVGGILALILMALRKKRFGQTIPFGPFLALGSFIALVFGQELWAFYLTRFVGF